MKEDFLSSEWEWCRTSVLLKDGTWLNDVKGDRIDIIGRDKEFHVEHYPYANVLPNGKIQACIATVQIWERE